MFEDKLQDLNQQKTKMKDSELIFFDMKGTSTLPSNSFLLNENRLNNQWQSAWKEEDS